MDANKIISHLVELSKGECSIKEEDILKLESKEEQMIALGLLTLHDEIEFNKRKLEAANREMEILLKEIHHRVKNNLQIIVSLLRLQKKYVEDDTVRSVLADCNSRISSMSRIHERLYQSNDLASISYRDYLRDLIDEMIAASGVDRDRIEIDLKLPDFQIDMNLAVPLGLLINEILTNVFKHGMSGDAYNKVYIHVVHLNGAYTVRIGDNGPGYPDDLFKNEQGSMGILLLHELTHQLDGSIEKIPSDEMSGVNYVINFKM